MSKGQYPRLWQLGLIQEKVRLRANHTCENCGMEFLEGTNLAKEAVNKLGKPMIGTVHHIDMNKQNCSKANLIYLCQSCHWTIHLLDWTPGKVVPHKWAANIPQWIIDRNLPFIHIRQLTMFGGEL